MILVMSSFLWGGICGNFHCAHPPDKIILIILKLNENADVLDAPLLLTAWQHS